MKRIFTFFYAKYLTDVLRVSRGFYEWADPRQHRSHAHNRTDKLKYWPDLRIPIRTPRGFSAIEKRQEKSIRRVSDIAVALKR